MSTRWLFRLGALGAAGLGLARAAVPGLPNIPFLLLAAALALVVGFRLFSRPEAPSPATGT